jgi:hypothetical protein
LSEAAATLTKISPGAGSGIGAEVIARWSRPIASIVQRFIVLLMLISFNRSVAIAGGSIGLLFERQWR